MICTKCKKVKFSISREVPRKPTWCDLCNKTLEAEIYKQRLDKVLNKCVIIGGGKWIYEMMQGVDIEYNSSEFYFKTRYGASYNITLETVESIIKDMGEQDE